MFGSLGWPEMLVLVVVALLVFGPDKLPGVVRDAAQMLRTVRGLAKDARAQVKTELGPEFSDFDIDSLNPRSFIRKNLFEGDDDEPGRPRTGATAADQVRRPQERPKPAETTPAYDPDTI